MNNLIEHARRELEFAGLFNNDLGYYNSTIGESVLELIKTFSNQEHSGFRAKMVINLFEKLVNYGTIVPFIPDKDDCVHAQTGSSGTLQSKRRPDVFSKDGGRTWYSIETDEIWKII